jgi:DNA-binding CsgD family transcriptional regulator
VNSIFNKLGVNDRAQAAAWGAAHGIDIYSDG